MTSTILLETEDKLKCFVKEFSSKSSVLSISSRSSRYLPVITVGFWVSLQSNSSKFRKQCTLSFFVALHQGVDDWCEVTFQIQIALEERSCSLETP